MDISVFKTFLLVAELLNVTQAAEQLNFTQPAVTTQIHSLEKAFGVQLFERVGRKMYMTEAGRTMLEYARQITEAYETAERKMEPFRLRQEVTIGVSTQMVNCLLPPVLIRLQQIRPEVSISVDVCMNTQAVLKGILANRYDLGFVHGVQIPSQLVRQDVWRQEIVWVGHRELVAAKQSDQITEYPFINFTPGSVFRDTVANTALQYGLKSTLEYSDSIAVKRAVLNGLGISFLPRILVETELAEGILVLFPAAPAMEMHISMVYHKQKIFSEAMKDLQQILAEELPDS